ncbi:MAG: alpha/beta fold hydrolase [Pseudomonadota bacterium]
MNAPTFRSALAAAAFALAGAPMAQACSTDTPCSLETGDYYVAVPEGAAASVPAVVFIHGFGGSGSGVFRNSGMITRFLDRGFAVIAPEGLKRPGRNTRGWSFHPFFTKARDEVEFITSVRDDAITKHGVDPDRVILAGFSIGGSMTAYLACERPDAFAAYAPLGGNFWRPHPTECAGPVKMLHTHGWTDGTVPLEGRVLRGEDARDPQALIQGDIFYAMRLWRETNGCFQLKADKFVTKGPFWRRKWERCSDGSALELALFPGGHVIPKGWVDLTVDWFEGLTQPQ